MKEELTAIRESMHKERKQEKDRLTQLILSETLDQQAVLTAVQEKMAEKKSLFNQHAESIIAKVADLHSTLTVEQKKKIIKKMEKDKGRHHWM